MQLRVRIFLPYIQNLIYKTISQRVTPVLFSFICRSLISEQSKTADITVILYALNITGSKEAECIGI